MDNKKLAGIALLNSFGVLAYIALVSIFMNNAEKIFGQMKGYLGPVAFLLLFVLSALVTGILILGRPILFYLDGKKAESVKLLLFTALWIFVLLLGVFGGIAATRMA
jgi:hypothetical protein